MKYTKEDMIKAFAVHPTAYLSDEEERQAAEEWLLKYCKQKRFEHRLREADSFAKWYNEKYIPVSGEPIEDKHIDEWLEEYDKEREELIQGDFNPKCSAESVNGKECQGKVAGEVNGYPLCQECYTSASRIKSK